MCGTHFCFEMYSTVLLILQRFTIILKNFCSYSSIFIVSLQSMREEEDNEEEEEEEVNDGHSDVELEDEGEDEHQQSGLGEEEKSTDYSSSFQFQKDFDLAKACEGSVCMSYR